MRKIIFITLLHFAYICTPCLLNANNYSPGDSTKHKKWYWGINASFLHDGYYFNNYDKTNLAVKKAVNYSDSILIPTIGYSFGGSVEKYIWKNISLKAGFSYTDCNFKTKWQYNNVGSFYDKCFIDYISLPISANYYFLTKHKMPLFVSVGISPSLPRETTISVDKLGNTSVSQGRGISSYDEESCTGPYFDGTCNFGLCLRHYKFNINIAVTFNYSLFFDKVYYDGLGGNNTFFQHLYSYGINAAITF
jgi:hypothetical protein